ncbi:NEK kinase [Besnoitia besnoiti]|uniref:non-specific serine/threonine protein kinase n=1 Tax=Besnoitia besnoiti TaxID=94643 RepID=A0A2A9MAL1_BESBE|nr:NEK kinase [Besnoitia besnoiti]PFH32422.1 NEK kinase [Besnoitia besnoiti]
MDSYEFIRQIRHGSSDTAMLACCKEDRSKLCIVKVVPLSLLERCEFPDRCGDRALKEAALLAASCHPFIVNYRNLFAENGNLHVVMDYGDGGDLHAQIVRMRAKRSSFDEGAILRWLVQLCLALNFLHEHNILHRDLKSRNVFLDGHDPGTVKLGGFGLAKALQSPQYSASTRVSAEDYISPEVCEERPYSDKSDIWFLGCILYELACLRLPFEEDSEHSVLEKIKKGMYHAVNPKYSDETVRLINDMLSVDPRRRPSTEEILSRPHIQPHLQRILRENKRKPMPSASVSIVQSRVRQIQNELAKIHELVCGVDEQRSAFQKLRTSTPEIVLPFLSPGVAGACNELSPDLPVVQDASSGCTPEGPSVQVGGSFAEPDRRSNTVEDVKRKRVEQDEQLSRGREEALSSIRKQYQQDRLRLAEKHWQRIELGHGYIENAGTTPPTSSTTELREATACSAAKLQGRQQRRREQQIGLRLFVARQRELRKRGQPAAGDDACEDELIVSSQRDSASAETAHAPQPAGSHSDIGRGSGTNTQEETVSGANCGDLSLTCGSLEGDGDLAERPCRPHRHRLKGEASDSCGRGGAAGKVEFFCCCCTRNRESANRKGSAIGRTSADPFRGQASINRRGGDSCKCHESADCLCRHIGDELKTQSLDYEAARGQPPSQRRESLMQQSMKINAEQVCQRSDTVVKTRTVIRQGQVLNGKDDLRISSLKRLDTLKRRLVKVSLLSRSGRLVSLKR